MKILIVLPNKKVNKFRLKQPGRDSRRFRSAGTLLTALERLPCLNTAQKKLSIAIKEVVDNHSSNINETLASNNKHYLLYSVGCFLEDFLSYDTLKKLERNYLRYGQI